ncbi:MAG: PEP-CTERM sorting domain-containing protein, partial [Pirellulales bacterium]|nr:PEP-CTERM sorting domain-containing protein [Pirellulales bacterium]
PFSTQLVHNFRLYLVGHLGVTLLGSAASPIIPQNGEANSSSSAIAEWDDDIQIFVPGHIAIRAVFNVSLEGSLGASADGTIANNIGPAANARAILLDANNSFLNIEPVQAFNTQNPAGGISLTQDFPKTLQVVVIPPGPDPFSIGMRLEASGAAATSTTGGNTAGYFAEVARSIDWGGLVGVFDFFTGERLDNYTITSASGFDYTRPFGVPEPSGIVLMSILLCATSLRRRLNPVVRPRFKTNGISDKTQG